MASLRVPGLLSGDAVQFIGGQGSIAARTVEVGGTVLAVHSIGSIRVYQGDRNYALALLGLVLLLGGLIQASQSSNGDGGGALVVAAIGAVMIGLNFLIKTALTLSIGTCDGRFTNISSTDKQFLAQLLDALKRKIDSDSVNVVGSFDISAKRVQLGEES